MPANRHPDIDLDRRQQPDHRVRLGSGGQRRLHRRANRRSTTSFATAGAHAVQLHVTDANGLSSTVAETITVTSPAPTLMQPFPVVRMAGSYNAAGVKISLLTVLTPVGATVTVTCRGGGCPTKSAGLVATSGDQEQVGHCPDHLPPVRALTAGRRGPGDMDLQPRTDRQVHTVRDPSRQGAHPPGPVPQLQRGPRRSCARRHEHRSRHMASGRCRQRTCGARTLAHSCSRRSCASRSSPAASRSGARRGQERAWSTRDSRTATAEPPGSLRGPRGSRAPEQRSPDRDRSASCRECSCAAEPDGRRPERRHGGPRRPRRSDGPRRAGRASDGPRCAGRSHRAREPPAAVLRRAVHHRRLTADPREAQAAARNLNRAAAPHLTARVEAMYRSHRSLPRS